MLRECPMTPLRLPSSAAAAACRCPTVAASTVSARRACQRCASSARPGSERPRPRLQRHAPRLGGFIRYRGVPRSPRGHKNPRGSRLAVCPLSPHRIRCDPSCHRQGVCPHDIATERDTALDCALRRPRRRQPTTLPVAALWMAAPYHAVTKASRAIFLAIPLPPLARRPLLPPVTTRSPHSAPDREPGSDRRQARLEPHPSPRQPPTQNGARRAGARPSQAVRAARKGAPLSPHLRGARGARQCARRRRCGSNAPGAMAPRRSGPAALTPRPRAGTGRRRTPGSAGRAGGPVPVR